MDKKGKIKINVKKNNSSKGDSDNPEIKKVKDGPEVRDIKESHGKKKFLKPKSPRIVKLKKNGKEAPDNTKHKPKKLLIAILALLLVFLIFSVLGVYFGYEYIKRDKIVKIIPQNTVFYTRLNINQFLSSYNEGQINSLVSRYLPKQLAESGSADYLNNIIFTRYSLSFDNDIAPLLKDEIALAALLVDYKDKKILTTAVIAEINDTGNVNEILTKSPGYKSTEESLYEDTVLYYEIFNEDNLNFHHATIGSFLILSKNKNSLKEIINVYKNKKPSLNQSKKFKQAVPFLTRLNMLYAYADFSDVSFDSFINTSSIDFNFKDFFPLYVFLKKIGTISLHAEVKDNGMLMHGFTPYKSENAKPVTPSEFIPANSFGSLSGNNLKEDFDNYLSLLENENPALNSSFSEYKEILIKDYDIDINNDIYPFFENSSEIIIIPVKDKNEMVFVLNESKNSKDSIEKVENAISHYYGLINPKKEAFNLKDGSLAYELYPDTGSFVFEESKFNDLSIKSITNPKAHTDFSYAFIDNNLLFGTSKNAVEEVISAKSKNTGLISQPEFEESLLLNNIQNYNSLLHLNLTKVFEKIGLTKEQSAYLNLKNFILTSRSDFNGTTIAGSLLIK